MIISLSCLVTLKKQLERIELGLFSGTEHTHNAPPFSFPVDFSIHGMTINSTSIVRIIGADTVCAMSTKKKNRVHTHRE